MPPPHGSFIVRAGIVSSNFDRKIKKNLLLANSLSIFEFKLFVNRILIIFDSAVIRMIVFLYWALIMLIVCFYSAMLKLIVYFSA